MKRLKNKFISATDFSRGKAIVKPFGCDENFCINKNGEKTLVIETISYYAHIFNVVTWAVMIAFYITLPLSFEAS